MTRLTRGSVPTQDSMPTEAECREYERQCLLVAWLQPELRLDPTARTNGYLHFDIMRTLSALEGRHIFGYWEHDKWRRVHGYIYEKMYGEPYNG